MITTIVQVLLAVFFSIGGFIKIFRVPFQVEHWENYQYPMWFLTVTGALEVIGALGLIAGIWNRYLAVGSGVMFIIIMLGAIHAHIFRAQQSMETIIPASICLILSVVVIVLNLRELA